MKTDSTIFSFLDPIDYLNFEFRSRQRKDPKFSLRRWALQLGYKNPSYLSHILKRERKLKVDLAARMGELFNMSAKEKSYFELIVMSTNSISPVEKNLYGKLIKKVRPKQFWSLDELPLEKFEFASEWYNWAILELFYLKDFFPHVDYIHRRLGPSVSKKMIKDSLTKLIELGFVVQTPDGFRRGSDNPVYMRHIPSSSVRAYHKTMLDKAKQALDRQTLEIRHSRGSMFALNKEKHAEVKKIIEEAHKKILELSAESDGDHVYHFNSQLFPVTESIQENLQ